MPECAKCGSGYALREGQDATRYCDQCAHALVEALEQQVAALHLEADELRSAREFYQDRWEIEEKVGREMRDAIRGAGFSTQYFDKELYCFPESVDACKLRDRIAETVYEMARHLRDLISKPPDLGVWNKKADGLLLKLRAIDFQRYQKEMERR